MIAERLSNKIANAGFVCACLVVAIHVPHPTAGFGHILDVMLNEMISQVAVPLFFAISGYLLADKIPYNNLGGYLWWRNAVRKRVRSLLVPFYIWPVISLVVCTATMVLIHWKAGVPLFKEALGGASWWSIFVGLSGLDFTAFIGPLWFVRALFCFVVLSPCLAWLMRRKVWGIVSLVFFLLMYVLQSVYGYLLPEKLNNFCYYGLSLRGIFCFSLGIFLNFRTIDVMSRSKVVGSVAAIIGISFFWSGAYGGVICCAANALAPLTLGCAVWMMIPSCRWPRFLVTSSFPIFLMHCIFIAVFRAFPGWTPNPMSTLGYGFYLTASIVGSMVVTAMMRHYFPKFAKVAFGGR